MVVKFIGQRLRQKRTVRLEKRSRAGTVTREKDGEKREKVKGADFRRRRSFFP